MTRADLERTTMAFTTTLTTLTKQMMNLANQVNNTNNNENRQGDNEGEQIRVPRGGNNSVVIVENPSSEEEGSYKKEIVVCRNRQDNLDYRVKANTSLFYRTMTVEEFLDKSML